MDKIETYGRSKAEIQDDLDEEIKAEALESEMSLVENECAHVYDDPDNGDMLDQLLADAKEFYDVDSSGWEALLRKTRQALSREDEPEKIKDILRAASTQATSELM